MPHKRAKRSTREQQRSQSGLDLPPGAQNTISNEAVPKSVARVLNAAQVRKDWLDRKRKQGDQPDVTTQRVHKRRRKDGEDGDERAKITIQPGESITHFNRRVEDSMRPAVRTAMKASSARARNARKAEEVSQTRSNTEKKGKDTDSIPMLTPDESVSQSSRSNTRRKGPTEFEHVSTSAPRRLNDIVMAPPEIKRLPRGAKASKEPGLTRGEGATLKQGALSMARKAMLEEERERAVKMYREMKKAKTGE